MRFRLCLRMSITLGRVVDVREDTPNPRRMSEAERYKPCPECESLSASNDAEIEHYEGFAYLRDPAELERFQLVSTDLRHRIAVNDVLAEYSMPLDIQCSMLPRGHRHRDGYIVRTRCGVVLKLGSQCGRHLIDNFVQVERTAKRAREYTTFVPTMQERLRVLRARYGEAVAYQKRLWAFREFLGAEAQVMAQEFENAYRVRNDAGEAAKIPGIELWNWEMPPIDRFGSRLRSLEFELDGWREKPPGITEQKEIRKRLAAIEDGVTDFLQWARVAALLVSREGMERACVVLDSSWEDTHTTAFDGRAGRMVGRTVSSFRRTRDRFHVTEDGLQVLGRQVHFAWS